MTSSQGLLYQRGFVDEELLVLYQGVSCPDGRRATEDFAPRLLLSTALVGTENILHFYSVLGRERIKRKARVSYKRILST